MPLYIHYNRVFTVVNAQWDEKEKKTYSCVNLQEKQL